MSRVLVIGYGNTLRGDDGAGSRAAEQLAREVPTITTRIVHQLTPELAEAVAEATLVFFIDAQVESTALILRTIQPSPDLLPQTHFLTPEALIALSREVYGKNPRCAYYIGIPAFDMSFSEFLSKRTADAVNEAVKEVKKILSSET